MYRRIRNRSVLIVIDSLPPRPISVPGAANFRIQTDGTGTWSTVNVLYRFPKIRLLKTFSFLRPIVRRYYIRTGQRHVRMTFVTTIVVRADINRKVDYTLARAQKCFFFRFGSIIFIFT